MKQITQLRLPYYSDSSKIYAKLRHLPWSIYLDSCHPNSKQGRYDIISAQPFIRITTQDNSTIIHTEDKEIHSKKNPLIQIKEILRQYPPIRSHFPFSGGALGYLSYDLGKDLQGLPAHAKKVIDIPEMMVGIYDWALIFDHHQQSCHLVSANRHSQTASLICDIKKLLTDGHQPNHDSFEFTSTWQSNITEQAYETAFYKVKNYIDDGTCYQVNLTHCFSANYQGSCWPYYRQLRKK